MSSGVGEILQPYWVHISGTRWDRLRQTTNEPIPRGENKVQYSPGGGGHLPLPTPEDVVTNRKIRTNPQTAQ